MLGLYIDTPFTNATLVDKVDIFTGTGVDTDFPLIEKAYTSLGAVAQYQNNQARQFNGGMARLNTPAPLGSLRLAAPPTLGAKIIAPGIIRVVFSAYNQTTVQGVTNPNIGIIPLYIVDPLDIATTFYEPYGTNSDLLIQVVDNDTNYGFGGSTDGALNIQLGYANPTTGATPTSWGAAGAALGLQNIGGYSNVSSGISAGATSVVVDDASVFDISQTTIFVQFDSGSPSMQEIVQVTGVNTGTNTVSITPTTYAHSSGNNLFHCGVKCYGKLTAPTGGSATAYFDLSTDLTFDEVDR
jgi:hypothetical protein